VDNPQWKVSLGGDVKTGGDVGGASPEEFESIGTAGSHISLDRVIVSIRREGKGSTKIYSDYNWLGVMSEKNTLAAANLGAHLPPAR